MVKRFLTGVTGLFVLCLSISAKAENGHYTGHQYHLADTADKKDSLKELAAPIHDDKKDFEEFAESAAMPLGITVENLNPQAVSFVNNYVERFSKKMEEIKERGRPYLVMMDEILAQYNLPKELKYLAVIESYLQANARSRAGAVGPWQFMPATARNMGLKVGKKYDERKDFVKSTHAASKYLASLYEMYGDWLLVIAAYNGGPGKVDAAIRRSGSRDFWTLQRYLPVESMNHVKKFIATHYMMEGQGGITTLTKDEAKDIVTESTAKTESTDPNAKTQTISGRYNSFVIMKHLAMDIAAFNKFNPNFDKTIASNGSYELKLPHEKMELFLEKKPVILNECMEKLLSEGTN